MIPEKFINTPQSQIESKDSQLEKPKVQFDIFYAPHGDAKDLSGFRERLMNSDILLTELPGWKNKEIEHLQALSDGKRIKDERKNHLKSSFQNQMENDISGSNKIILSADIPEGTIIEKAFMSLQAELQDIVSHFFKVNRTKRDLEKFKSDIINIASEMGKIMKKREAYILEHIDKSVEYAIQQYPKLREKEKIKVLMFLGAAHTAISHQMIKNGKEVERSFNPMPFTYDPFAQLLRAYILDKKPAEDLPLKILLEILLDTLLSNKDSGEENVVQIISKLNQEEIEQVLLDNSTILGSSPILIRILKEKKIDIPKLTN